MYIYQFLENIVIAFLFYIKLSYTNIIIEIYLFIRKYKTILQFNNN